MNSVVLVGRMNVGKSTLFNRLATNVRSITLDYEGVTRDFIKDQVSWNGRTFEMIDSGGISFTKAPDELTEKVRQKVFTLVEKSDVVVFVVDGVTGIMPEDRNIATYLHKLGKKVVVAVNKGDTKQAQEQLGEFYGLGFNAVTLISAQHGTGIGELLDLIIEELPTTTAAAEEEPSYKVVLLGRPNVGKSSLMNLLVQEERSIVSDIPGTTREAVSESIMFYKESIELTDTPGIRRQRSISGELEPLMVKSAFSALRDSNIVLLLIDGTEHALTDQELKLAFYAFTEQYKSLILLVNKVDKMTDTDRTMLDTNFDVYKHFIGRIPVLFISCLTGKNTGRVLPLVHKLWERNQQCLDSAELSTLFITELQKRPLIHARQKLLVYDAEQVSTFPLTIVLKVNEPDWFGPSQLGFFENLLRSKYDMVGVPIKFIVRKSYS